MQSMKYSYNCSIYSCSERFNFRSLMVIEKIFGAVTIMWTQPTRLLISRVKCLLYDSGHISHPLDGQSLEPQRDYSNTCCSEFLAVGTRNMESSLGLSVTQIFSLTNVKRIRLVYQSNDTIRRHC